MIKAVQKLLWLDTGSLRKYSRISASIFLISGMLIMVLSVLSYFYMTQELSEQNLYISEFTNEILAEKPESKIVHLVEYLKLYATSAVSFVRPISVFVFVLGFVFIFQGLLYLKIHALLNNT